MWKQGKSTENVSREYGKECIQSHLQQLIRENKAIRGGLNAAFGRSWAVLMQDDNVNEAAFTSQTNDSKFRFKIDNKWWIVWRY